MELTISKSKAYELERLIRESVPYYASSKSVTHCRRLTQKAINNGHEIFITQEYYDSAVTETQNGTTQSRYITLARYIRARCKHV